MEEGVVQENPRSMGGRPRKFNRANGSAIPPREPRPGGGGDPGNRKAVAQRNSLTVFPDASRVQRPASRNDPGIA